MGEGAILLARGARAAEAALLDAVEVLAAEARADPARLAQPVRIVVPSESLRRHVAARLAGRLGAAAGLVVETSWRSAWAVLERAGAPLPRTEGGARLLPVRVQRRAREEKALAAALEGLVDGYAAVAAAVTDLLDAGFEPALAEGVAESLAAHATGAVRDRALALVRVAAGVVADLRAEGLEPPSAVFFAAARALAGRPGALPARAVFVHGFADATGAQGDFLEALVRHAGAQVLVDLPPDPAAPSAAAPGVDFTRRLRERLAAAETPAPEVPLAPARLRGVRAAGAWAEARHVACGVRRLLDEGVRPEDVGVVARDLHAWRAPLGTQLRRLGVPFSSDARVLAPEGRRTHALLALLEEGAAAAADRWLDAAHRRSARELADLRLALHGMGIGRLRDVARLDLDALLGGAPRYALPVRRGLVAVGADGAEVGADDAEEGPRAGRARRRTVPRAALEQARDAARALVARLAALDARPALGARLAALRRLLHALGWTPQTPGFAEVQGRLRELEGDVGAERELGDEELRLLLRRSLDGVGTVPLGGAGGGVQVLSAMEARGRTFEHLFVLGLGRDVFPRPVTDDPLLPDDLRKVLERSTLPDVAVKERGMEEERYLFAQLCAAAPQVTLSWPEVSDDGKERPPSPLVERLRLLDVLPVETAAPVLADGVSGPRPAFEHAVRAGLGRDREALRVALEVGLGAASGASAAAAAGARVALLDELDPPPGSPAQRRLGPWFGFVGPPTAADPRLTELHVTRLEGLHYCPWQSFLEKVLGLEPLPDALAALPDVTPLLLGNAVHGVLEAVVGRAGAAVGTTLDDARARGPVDVPWPGPAEEEALLEHAAAAAAREEGIVLPGFARLLARRARPLVAALRALDWNGGVRRAVLGAELRGSVALAERGGRRLHFRADRVDVGPDDALVLVDYKTGKPISDAKGDDTRRRHLLAQIAGGRRLQVALYARAGGAGAYLFAGPDLDPEVARVAVVRGDTDVEVRFDAAVAALLDAWEQGTFPPRLVDRTRGKEAPACARCAVADACLRGDSGSRRRIVDWMAVAADGEGAAERAARAVLALAEAS